jgi:hypothetical protein
MCQPCKGWRSWNLFAQQNDDASMRAMMHAFVDKSRSVDGKPTSLAEVGYISVGMVRPSSQYVALCRGTTTLAHNQMTALAAVDCVFAQDDGFQVQEASLHSTHMLHPWHLQNLF